LVAPALSAVSLYQLRVPSRQEQADASSAHRAQRALPPRRERFASNMLCHGAAAWPSSGIQAELGEHRKKSEVSSYARG